MKRNINYILLALMAIMFAACDKNAIQDINTTPVGAYFRVHNFAVGGPTVNIYANEVKISAIGSTTGIEAAAGIAANGIFPGTNSYLSLEPGSIVLKAKVPALATVNAGVTTNITTQSVVAGRYYSYFTSGIYDATAKTTDAFIIEDILPAIDTGMAYVRIVSAIPNSATGFNLTGVNTTTLASITIAPATGYKAASPFVKVPNGIYNLTSVNTSTPVNTITRAAVSFSKGFIYTITTRGTTLTASTLGLDLTRNR